MHDRITDVLGVEVVGEVTRVGNAFFDVALGRVALPDLSRERIAGHLEQLRQAFGDGMQVSDRLHLQNPEQLIRGLVEVSIRCQESSAPYLLEMSTAPLLAFYHRRFFVEEKVLGDLSGVMCRGLAKLVAQGEGPLRALSRYEVLQGRMRELLDAGIQHAIVGKSFDPLPGLTELVPKLRDAWKLIPWSLRQGLSPCWKLDQDRIAPHDRVLRRTLLLAAEQLTGKVIYQYIHQHNPLEEYDQVLDWMTEIHQAMVSTYPPPTYATAIGRASSLDRFLDGHPGLRAVVGPPLDKPS